VQRLHPEDVCDNPELLLVGVPQERRKGTIHALQECKASREVEGQRILKEAIQIAIKGDRHTADEQHVPTNRFSGEADTRIPIRRLDVS
jgi:hypothetical protein